MKDTDKKEIRQCIKHRIKISEPLYYVHTLLKSYGMDMYGKLCCNRIANTLIFRIL